MRRGGLDLDPAAVVDVVQGLADLLEVDPPLAEQIAAVLGVELADQLAQRADFLETSRPLSVELPTS